MLSGGEREIKDEERAQDRVGNSQKAEGVIANTMEDRPWAIWSRGVFLTSDPGEGEPEKMEERNEWEV